MDPRVKVPCHAVAVRYVHDATTGEFLNVGVVLRCAARGYAGASFLGSYARVTTAFPGADGVILRRVRDAVVNACAAWTARQGELFAPGGDVASLVRGAVPDEQGIALSPVIAGVTADPERTLRDLFRRYVDRYTHASEAQSRDDGDVWRAFTRRVREPSVLHKLQTRELVSGDFPSLRVRLDHAWKNGSWHAAYPLSLDLSQRHVILSKATSLVTHLGEVRPRDQDVEVTVLVGLPGESAPEGVRAAARDGLALLEKRLVDVARVLPEAEADSLAEQMVHDLTTEHEERPTAPTTG